MSEELDTNSTYGLDPDTIKNNADTLIELGVKGWFRRRKKIKAEKEDQQSKLQRIEERRINDEEKRKKTKYSGQRYQREDE